MTPTAFAAVRDDQGRVLLVRRRDSGNWELPGGRVELGESATTAAEREVAEESSVTIKSSGWPASTPTPGTVPVDGQGVEAHRQRQSGGGYR